MECLKKGFMTVFECVVRLMNECFDLGVVHMDWLAACIVSLDKRKCDKYECSNSRGIRLLVVGKLYGKC